MPLLVKMWGLVNTSLSFKMNYKKNLYYDYARGFSFWNYYCHRVFNHKHVEKGEVRSHQREDDTIIYLRESILFSHSTNVSWMATR